MLPSSGAPQQASLCNTEASWTSSSFVDLSPNSEVLQSIGGSRKKLATGLKLSKPPAIELSLASAVPETTEHPR
jgi:hypothetical protein